MFCFILFIISIIPGQINLWPQSTGYSCLRQRTDLHLQDQQTEGSNTVTSSTEGTKPIQVSFKFKINQQIQIKISQAKFSRSKPLILKVGTSQGLLPGSTEWPLMPSKVAKSWKSSEASRIGASNRLQLPETR